MPDENNSDDLMLKSSYFSHENAIFRRHPSKQSMSVDEVLNGKKFVPYKGDRLEPAMYGTPISADEVKKMMEESE